MRVSEYQKGLLGCYVIFVGSFMTFPLLILYITITKYPPFHTHVQTHFDNKSRTSIKKITEDCKINKTSSLV